MSTENVIELWENSPLKEVGEVYGYMYEISIKYMLWKSVTQI